MKNFRCYELAKTQYQAIIDILNLEQLKTEAHKLGGSLFQLIRKLRAEAENSRSFKMNLSPSCMI